MPAAWRQSHIMGCPEWDNIGKNTNSLTETLSIRVGQILSSCHRRHKSLSMLRIGVRNGWKLPMHELSSDISPSGVNRGTLSWRELPNQAHLYSEHSIGTLQHEYRCAVSCQSEFGYCQIEKTIAGVVQVPSVALPIQPACGHGSLAAVACQALNGCHA